MNRTIFIQNYYTTNCVHNLTDVASWQSPISIMFAYLEYNRIWNDFSDTEMIVSPKLYNLKHYIYFKMIYVGIKFWYIKVWECHKTLLRCILVKLDIELTVSVWDLMPMQEQELKTL